MNLRPLTFAPRSADNDEREADNLDREPGRNQDIDQQHKRQVEIELELKVFL